MDSSSDDEIFFGPITKKEEQIAKKFQNRRTEVFPSMPLFRRRSAAPSLESLEENDAQKCSHDSDTSQAIHVQDVSSNLSSTGSGQFSLDDDSVHRNSSHLSHSVPSSEPEEQEALFVFTSHKGVKRVSQDTSTDVSLCVAVSESDSQKSFSWQNLSENSCTSAMSGSLHTSCDSALHTNSHSDMSNDESKIFDNESIISKEPVDLSSQSIETHSSRFSRPIVEYEEKLKGIPGLSKALMKILVAVKEETYVGGVSVSDAGTKTSVTVPETSVTVPETSVTVPETSVTVPETSITVPETSVTVPETSVTVPETSVTVPAAIYTVLETTASESETPEDGLETTHNISDTTVNVPVISVTVPESTDSEFEAIDFVPSKVICEGDLGVSCEQRLQEPQINKDFMCEIENESEKISKPTLSDGTTNNILPIIQDSAADSCQTIQTTCNDIRETSSGEMNNASKVRLSYFSGLDVINVDSNEVYGDFSIEDNLHTAIDCGEDLSHEDSLSLDDLHVESYGSANKAVIVSLSDYSQISTLSCNSRSLSLSAPESHHSNNSIEKIQGYKSPEHESFSPQNLNISKKSFDTSSESVQGTQSPCPKFNDTIEEMEMMLKYGLSYGEGNQKKVVEAGGSVGKDSSDVKVPDNKDNTFENIADDPIVCSTRSSSIASAVSNFQPVLESTRASSYQEHFMTPRVHVEDVGSNETRVIFSPSKALSEIKKGPPPKPPRKFCSPDVSPQKNSCHKTPTQCILKSFSVGAKETELINVHKMSTRRQIPQVSKITTPKQVKGDKIKFYTPKQPSVIQSSGRTPSSAPPTGLGLANSGSSTKFQKISRPGQSPANTPNLPRSATRFQPHTPVSRHHTPTIQKSSNVLKKQPTPYSSLPPRPTPNKIGKFIMKQPSNRGIKQYTPQERSTQTQLKVNSASKAPSSSPFKINNLRFKSGMNIESPVAKYLKENPPPPFLVNVKSRHKISPLKTKDECSPRKKPHQLVNQTESKEHHAQYQEAPRVTEVVETSFAKREVALTRIQDNLNRLGLKMKSRQTSEEEELVQPVHINKKENVLPKAMYSSAVPIILNKEDNKENERLRRRMKMLTDNQPALVMKHKGHRMMSKVTFEENLIDGLSPKDSRSPTHKKGVISFPEPRPSLTGSLLEVSIYESHEAQYTNALK